MVEIRNLGNGFYWPPEFKGLESLALLPGGEVRGTGIHTSSAWIFNLKNHNYQPEILGNDIGCGMTAFILDKIDPKKAADVVYQFIKANPILGRGNHFIDICSQIENPNKDPSLSIAQPYNLLIIHTDVKSGNRSTPRTIEEAIEKQERASERRIEFGKAIASQISDYVQILGDWTHNSVEVSEGKAIYRKGTLKVQPQKLFMLPAHLGAKILFYAVSENNIPPFSSLPHGTGRSGPRSQTKVPNEIAREVRRMVYVPKQIFDASLRSEHPSCYNGFDEILDSLGKYIIPVGESQIRSYVGKV